MERRIRVIYNPAANQSKAARLLPVLKQFLGSYGTGDLVQTSHPGEAIELTIEALAAGYDIVAAAGGDGTVNEVVNGFLSNHDEQSKATLGIIPIGSGNDLAWSIGITSDVQTACARLLVGEIRPLDIGRIADDNGRSRYFCNGVGIGFDGTAAREARRVQWVGGFGRYLVGVIRTFALYYKAPSAVIHLDGRTISQQVLMLTVSNGRRHAGGFLITPEAAVDDGYLDLCIVPRLGRLTILQMIPRFLRGTHVRDARIQMERGQNVTVDVPDGLAVHLDGEIFAECARWLEIQILPHRLNVIV